MIRNAWHFYYALRVLGGLGIALLTS
ncbi:DUF3265 domain-containing protein [Vibrio sp. Isolate31]|nr:DUF3265 domain-containing protein [Vibrio sp. Isolate32]MCG9600722.1 DUF3265 domain-containing protein [Vibrio sp. Isolate31]